MLKFITPIILIVISGGLFFSYIDPAYKETGVLQEKQSEYDNALTKSKELREIRSSLLGRYNTFSEDDVDRLKKLIPDSIDNVRLIMEINQMAVKNGGMIRSVDVVSDVSDSDKKGDLGPNLSGYESIGINFTVEAKYDDFINFIKDLGNSLRIVDIKDYSLSIGQGDVYKHTMSIKTYWLK